MQVIYHTGPANTERGGPALTGTLLKDIAQDVPTISPKFSADEMLQHSEHLFKDKEPSVHEVHAAKAHLIIFNMQADNKSIAKLAYAVSFMATTERGLMKPFYILDTSTRHVLAYWDDLKKVRGRFTIR